MDRFPRSRGLLLLVAGASPTSAASPTPAASPTLAASPRARGSRPHDVAPAADGGVWYTAQASGKLGWLDPATEEFTSFALPSPRAQVRQIHGPAPRLRGSGAPEQAPKGARRPWHAACTAAAITSTCGGARARARGATCSILVSCCTIVRPRPEAYPHRIEAAMALPTSASDLQPDVARWIWEPGARRVRWNDRAAELLGAAAPASTAELLALVHPGDRGRLGQEARRARRTLTPFAVACRVASRSGPARWLSLHGQWQGAAGAPLCLVGLALELSGPAVPRPPLHDLTQITAALRASEAREQARAAELQTVLDAVPAIVWIAHDPECRRITGNVAAQALLRMAPGSNVSKSAPDDERPVHFRVMRNGAELAPEELPVQLAATGVAVEDFEEDVVFDDGTVRTLLGNATPLWDAHGRPRGAVAAFLDITERQVSERERQRLLAEARAAQAAAEAALRLRDELVAVITHDLKNPLTVILGQAQLLQRRLRRPELDLPRATDAAAAVEQAARQVLGQIGELLDVAQLQSGEPLELRREQVDLAALVRRIAETFQYTTERHQIEVIAPPGLPAVALDAARFERALSNLLANALKYSLSGGTVTVALELVMAEGDAGPALLLSVSDQGLGIPAADLPRIFERYHRASNVLSIPGTGLGLASARHIVEQHGGTMAITSREGAGTTVAIRLPLT